jgi:hypothetical protein
MTDIATGDIVKCVDGAPDRSNQIMPAPDMLYVVESVRPADDGPRVRLKELKPTCRLGGSCGCGGCGWEARRFRRVYRPDPGLIARLLRTMYAPGED